MTSDKPNKNSCNNNASNGCCAEENIQSECCAEPVVVTSCNTTAVASCCDAVADSPAENNTACCDGTTNRTDTRLSVLLQTLHNAWTLIPLILLTVILFDPGQFRSIVTIALTALSGTLPYIILAVLMIAYLKASGAENLVSSAFQGRENRMIIVAALFGGLAPFCSCEVIPFIAGLLALGVPVSAVMAFWLSSPLIDPPSLMITAGALGWQFAAGKTLAALFLGLFGGFTVKYLLTTEAFNSPLKKHSTSGCVSGSCNSGAPYSKKVHWKFWLEKPRQQLFISQGLENVFFLLKWLSVAYLLEALLITYVPASLIGSIVGGEGITPIITGALVGLPAYLNSYAAPPLVAGLMEQGMSAGSAMAFMVAGAISSIPAMTAVWSLVRKQVFFAYLGLGIGGAILFAMGFAIFFPLLS